MIYDGTKWDYVIAWLYEESWVQFSSLFIPYEYQRVEYLQSTGTQAIRTGLVPINANFGFKIDFQPQSVGNNLVIMGISNAYTISSAEGGRFRYKSDGYIQFTGMKANVRTKIIKHQGTIVAPNGATKNYTFSTTYTLQEGISLGLFCNVIDRKSVKEKSRIMLFACEFFDENDKLVSELIPCYRKSDKEPGLYDRVRKIFLTNVETGSFIVGADIL